ncbi:MAG: hypothetical protein ACKOEM_14550 [Planctomycetia bacterium]
MLQRLPTLALVQGTICLALSLGQFVRAAETSLSPWPADKSPGLAALAKAAEQNRYAYVFFWKTGGEATQRKREAFDAALATLSDRADAVSVCVSAPEEKATVDAFKVSRAPMPLVLAIAPNGAVTKAWPLDFQAATAGDGIVSDGAASCMKALQGNKMVLVSVQNSTTSHAGEALEAAAGFLADPRFAQAAENVVLDPADPAEATFLASLKVSPTTDKAITVLLAPPGNPVATFVGAVSTAAIVAKVTDAKSGCCPDGKCGPGQCCPGGKCGPSQSSSAKGVSK